MAYMAEVTSTSVWSPLSGPGYGVDLPATEAAKGSFKRDMGPYQAYTGEPQFL